MLPLSAQTIITLNSFFVIFILAYLGSMGIEYGLTLLKSLRNV
ncbi:MAG: hypothetical protein WC656_11845 [Sulfurimonas sp.]|jgi:hypothetical protein